MSKSQESYKEQLSVLLDKLNDAIGRSTSKLYKKEKNPQTMKTLEHMLSVKQRELLNTKSQSKIYRQQLDIVSNKANERFSTER